CALEGIAFAPFFPLGGFTPLQSDVLDRVAARVEASAQQVALAWLLQRSSTMVLIPGTSSVAHLRENVSAASLQLPAEAIEELDAVGRSPGASTHKAPTERGREHGSLAAPEQAQRKHERG